MKERVFLSKNQDGVLENYWMMHFLTVTDMLTNRVNCSGSTFNLTLIWRAVRDLRALLEQWVYMVDVQTEGAVARAPSVWMHAILTSVWMGLKSSKSTISVLSHIVSWKGLAVYATVDVASYAQIVTQVYVCQHTSKYENTSDKSNASFV